MSSTDPNVFMRWSIGAVKITRVLELPPVSADPAIFIQTDKQAIIERRAWLCPDFAEEDGSIKLHFQAFIIEARGLRILVDPCIGNDKPRSHPALSMLNNPFLERLAAAGYPRESIDYVLCTHLHVDHCGWNTMLVDGKWLPTFPNAQYLFAKDEYQHLQVDDHGDARAVLEDSVKPIVDAGLARFVDPDHVIVDEVRLQPTPGHTPGHCSVVVSSQGQEAVITGDVLHHPVQVAIPHVGDNFCWDQQLATSARRRLLEQVSNRKALLLGSHVSGPTGIYLKPDGDSWTIDGTANEGTGRD
ncbi:MAG TPA: MBL fold metallo-hydrolase [Steroidobacter sp.]|uniref:MBL fold metallo-hydrolase n=1 Tax=Steroidobacter sp. TaxID=1978227 RepID=UPI002ED895F6